MPITLFPYFIAGFLIAIFGIFVLKSDTKSELNKAFFFLSLSLFLWNLSNFIGYFFGDQSVTLYIVRSSSIWASFIPIFFQKLILVLHRPTNTAWVKIHKIQRWFSYTCLLIVIILSPTQLNVVSINMEQWGMNYVPGPLYVLLLIYFIFSFSFIFSYLKNSKGNLNYTERKQVNLISIGTFFALSIGIVVNVILPLLGQSRLSDLSPLSALIFLLCIAYAITKHHLFNIKVITIELVTCALWVTILIRALLATTLQERLTEVGLLIVTIVFGTMLIQGTLHEIYQRERIEKLAKDLQNAYASLKELNDHLEAKVAEQTQEIRMAYEVEKRARAELQRLNSVKDQFITSTQHHLRTPLTSLKWALESIKPTSRSKAKPELLEGLTAAEESVKKLGLIIENFISITGEKPDQSTN